MSPKIKSKPTVSDASSTMRASISFPSDVYQELERIAEAKKVSLAWVIREAAEKYVADQWPLFANSASDRRPV
jgi:metal-responsive CopG/Arc/MetJ family transcriptional regulator